MSLFVVIILWGLFLFSNFAANYLKGVFYYLINLFENSLKAMQS